MNTKEYCRIQFNNELSVNQIIHALNNYRFITYINITSEWWLGLHVRVHNPKDIQ